MQIENNMDSMLRLWKWLAQTEEYMKSGYKRFCPRGILKLWFPERVNGDFIYDVCHLAELEGYEQLPSVRLYPRKHRELLRAIIAVTQGIGMRHVDIHALDRAFSQVFPHATPLNVSKKKRK